MTNNYDFVAKMTPTEFRHWESGLNYNEKGDYHYFLYKSHFEGKLLERLEDDTWIEIDLIKHSVEDEFIRVKHESEQEPEKPKETKQASKQENKLSSNLLLVLLGSLAYGAVKAIHSLDIAELEMKIDEMRNLLNEEYNKYP